MILLPSVYRPAFGDEIVLRSIDWLENFPWTENGLRTERNKYEVCLHVKDFGPKELQVKTADGFIIVEGRHDEKQDEYGLVSRSFVRKYALPEDCIAEKVESRLSSGGVLTITAPRKAMIKRDTVIPVAHEGAKAKSKL